MKVEGGAFAEVVARALATELKVSESVVRSAKSLKAELKMDSISIVNVVFAIEDELGIEIDLERPMELDSLDAIVGVVRALANAR